MDGLLTATDLRNQQVRSQSSDTVRDIAGRPFSRLLSGVRA
jgi:hypothetical protein